MTHLLESSNLEYLIFSEIAQKKMDSLAKVSLFGFFNWATNYIYWIAFGSASNSFCLLKSNANKL